MGREVLVSARGALQNTRDLSISCSGPVGYDNGSILGYNILIPDPATAGGHRPILLPTTVPG